MSRERFPLDNIKVAAPCTADWRFMFGNERVRFCGQCSQYVYNLSAMTREQAEDLVLRHEGQLCVRFYKRKDGTIITNNCPVGLRALKAKYNSTKAIILRAALMFLAYLGALFLIERLPVAKPVIVGAMDRPVPFPGFPTITKSESFIRDRAIYRVTPVAHTDVNKPVEGIAVVKIVISLSGVVEMATLIQGPESVKGIAEEAARRWEFEPMNDGGKPVRIESTLTFHFGRLRSEGVSTGRLLRPSDRRRPVEDKKACDECL